MFICLSLPFILYHYKKEHRILYETWGCGQPVSTARNEYTGTAFTKPVQMWLASIYRPVNETQATYSASPFMKDSFKFETRIEQIFEQHIYAPVISFILGESRTIKVVQTGSIHAYLSYIFGVLVVLFMFMILGGR
jgi:hypothetical protein